MQSLLDREETLLMFNEPGEMEQRNELVMNQSHIREPRGLLVYHIELICLLARCVTGKNQPVAMQVRALLPLPLLCEHVLQTGLPLPLRAAYLSILDDGFLHSEKAWPSDWLEEMVQARRSIHRRRRA